MKESRLGETKVSNRGSLMTIEGYNNSMDVLVRFIESDYLVRTQYTQFKNGTLKSPYDKSIFKIGYLGEGNYKMSVNGKSNKQYDAWYAMMRRCYSEKYQEKNLSYIGCEVDERWHNFQNFAEWYNQNYYEVNDEPMQLDKDILIKGNRVYSPDACIFVPIKINTLFIKNNNRRGDLPIGVMWNERYQKYTSQFTNRRKGVKLGVHKTQEEAFLKYKTQKEELIKQVAEEYKNEIPYKLYNVMINYKIEITD